MDKTDAITQMLKGYKVTHYNFSPEEWVTINGKMENSNQHKYLLEDGVECSEMEFWKWRLGSEWYDGWALWMPVPIKSH